MVRGSQKEGASSLGVQSSDSPQNLICSSLARSSSRARPIFLVLISFPLMRIYFNWDQESMLKSRGALTQFEEHLTILNF